MWILNNMCFSLSLLPSPCPAILVFKRINYRQRMFLKSENESLLETNMMFLLHNHDTKEAA